jgi:hypothetical protein
MEVALAATVLALTLVGMIGAIESGTQMLDLSRKQTMAAQILHSEIDQLRVQNWTTISGYNPGNATATVQPGNGYQAGPTSLTASNDPSLAMFIAQYPAAANIFTLTRTVSCVEPVQANSNPSPYPSPPLLILVTFTITWTGVTGQNYTRTSATYVGLNGLSLAYQKS